MSIRPSDRVELLKDWESHDVIWKPDTPITAQRPLTKGERATVIACHSRVSGCWVIQFDDGAQCSFHDIYLRWVASVAVSDPIRIKRTLLLN
jgi:hypothetical protein